MTQLAPDFKEFLKLLNDKNVRYLLIGGYAVSHYGYVRPTGDMDIWIAVAPENAEKVAEVVREFGFSNVSAELFSKPGQIIRMGLPPLKIEVSTSIDGVDFEVCFNERLVEVIDGLAVNLISLKRLRQNKLASGRLKDLNDLEHLPKED
jgi:predicted nucleotidyltransferase